MEGIDILILASKGFGIHGLGTRVGSKYRRGDVCESKTWCTHGLFQNFAGTGVKLDKPNVFKIVIEKHLKNAAAACILIPMYNRQI